MAKGPIITDQIQVLIASVYQKHPKWKAPEVRNEVIHILHKNNPKLPPGWPSLSTVQKVLAIARRRIGDTPINALDKPWSLGAALEYNMPPEMVPLLMQIQNSLKGILTIREVRWMIYVYQIPQVRMDMESLNEEILSDCASPYVAREQVCEMMNLPLDTSDIDAIANQGLNALYIQYFEEMAKIPHFTDAKTNELKQQVTKQVQYLQGALGLDVDIPTFTTIQGLLKYAYILELENLASYPSSKEVLRSFIIHTQAWIKENEPDFNNKIHPRLTDFIKENGGTK
ncbi:hypothetical protein ACFLU0_01785 [Chloroflexota bacterium]